MKQKRPEDEILKVKITSPKEVVFEGEAASVSSKNTSGKFDILPLHANFITLVENQPIIIRKTDKQTKMYTFPVAIIYTRDNQVNIYTDIQIYNDEVKG